jgi:hypothetical protein
VAGTYFAALDLRFWVALGTTASSAPTSATSLTEVLSLTNTSISVNSDTQQVLDYQSDFGFTSQIVTGNSYTISCALNLDPTSEGYKVLKRAAQDSAQNVAVRWYRELPLVGPSNADPQVDAGVAFVSNWSESLEAGSIASCSFDLLGYGAPKNYQQGDPIATLTVTSGGSGLAEAASAVPLVALTPAGGNGSGKSATVTTTVDGSGVIQTVTIVDGGNNYKVGDTLTILDASVYGSGDTLPVLTVATVA